jgi:hypothetical protein
MTTQTIYLQHGKYPLNYIDFHPNQTINVSKGVVEVYLCVHNTNYFLELNLHLDMSLSFYTDRHCGNVVWSVT